MQRDLLKLAILGAIVTPLFSITPAHAQATRTWVSGVGDDVNPCSRTAPCKTFAGAISKTATNGEINCIDPAGFGQVTITKSITIDCGGTFGSILASSSSAIIVNSATARVIIRNLSLNGLQLATHGVRIIAASQVTVQNVQIFGFTTNAIDMATAAGVSQLFVLNVEATQVARAVNLSATGTGVSVATINGLNAFAYTTSGVEAASAGTLAFVTNSVLSGGTAASAIFTSSGAGTIDVMNSVITGNNFGIRLAGVGSTVRMTGNKFFANNTSTSIAAGTLASGGDNKLDPAGATPNGAAMATQ